ncbi:MAG: caspase family protein [Magnetococcales bacterium]|nr:caspase family protein [Magnetococcales bacterium]
MNHSLKALVISLSVAALIQPLPAESAPGGGFGRAAGTTRVVNAIRTNTRQIFKPTFSVRSRYASAMNATTMSDDGKWLASGGGNEAAQLWNLTTGQRELDLRGHAGAVQAVAFVPGSGTYGYSAKPGTKQAAHRKGFLVTAGVDGEARLWSMITGETVRRFRGHAGPVNAVAVTPDGQTLFTAGEDGAIKAWKLDDGSPVRTLSGHAGPVKSLLLSRDGKNLASGGMDGALRIWNPTSGAMVQEFSGGEGPVLSLSWSGDGSRVAAGHESGAVRVHPLKGGSDLVITAPSGATRGVAMRPDNSQIATAGADGVIRLWSLSDGALIKELPGHQKAVQTLTYGDNGRLLLSGSQDQTLRVWKPETGAELARLVSMRSGWAVVAPDGRFDGTLDGALEDRLDAIQWTGDGMAFSVDGFVEKYYQPALLGKLLARRDKIDPKAPNVTEGFMLPPKIGEIARTRGVGSAKSVDLQIPVEDQGGGIDEVRVYHNGKIVDQTRGRKDGTGDDKTRAVEKVSYQVDLVNGANVFRVVGLSNDRIEGEATSVTIQEAGGDEEPPKLHVMAVGINKYTNPEMNLNFAVPDAKGIMDFFMKSYASLFRTINTYTLHDRNATRGDIIKGLTDLQKVPAKDTVIIYLAGHGETLDMDDIWYFLPQDLPGTAENEIHAGGLSSMVLKDQIARIAAHKITLLIDACKSGQAVDAFAEFKNQKPMATLSRSTGIHIATATTGSQLANELGSLGHGIFTYALLQGLGGKADTQPKDNNVSVEEILAFAKEQVPILNQKYDLDAQTPVVNSRGDNFVIAKPTGK